MPSNGQVGSPRIGGGGAGFSISSKRKVHTLLSYPANSNSTTPAYPAMGGTTSWSNTGGGPPSTQTWDASEAYPCIKLTQTTNGWHASWHTPNQPVAQNRHRPKMSFLFRATDELANHWVTLGWIQTTWSRIYQQTQNVIEANEAGAWMSLNMATGDKKWKCVTANGVLNTNTVTDSNLLYTAGWHKGVIDYSVAGSVKFYMDGTLIATNTTTLPPDSANMVLGISCQRIAGATMSTFLCVNSIEMEIDS